MASAMPSIPTARTSRTAEDCHQQRWRLLQTSSKRRHSIQVSSPATFTQPFVPDFKPQNKNRRQSISESIQNITKSMSSSLHKAMHIGSNPNLDSNSHSAYNKTRLLNKSFFRDILSAHYKQPELKVTKFSMRKWTKEEMMKSSNSIVMDMLLVGDEYANDGQEDEEKKQLTQQQYDDRVYKSFQKEVRMNHQEEGGGGGTPVHPVYDVIYEVELTAKDTKVRQKLDLIIKCPRRQNPEVEEEANSPLTTRTEADYQTSPERGKLCNSPQPTEVLTPNTERKYECEREFKAYTQVIQDMWDYLQDDKGIERPEDLIGLPIRYRSDPKQLTLSDLLESEEADLATDKELHQTYLILQDLYASDYQLAEIDRDENGLDFTHTILTLAKLATFHAVSYCMRKEKKLSFHQRYPFLKEDPVYRPATSSMFGRVQKNIAERLRKVFAQEGTAGSIGIQNVDLFLDTVQNMHQIQTNLLKPNDKFGVICHGDLWRQNVLFSYGSSLESQSDAIGVRFDDLHLCRYSSCVTDILYFLFTTVDCDTRRDHSFNFLAAYYDHFSKTVRLLSPKLMPIFTRDELMTEFRRLLMYGFLEGLCLYSSVFESQMRRAGLSCKGLEVMEKEEEERAKAKKNIDPRDCTWSGMVQDTGKDDSRPRYRDYRDSVVAIVTDVIRFRNQSGPSKKLLITNF